MGVVIPDDVRVLSSEFKDFVLELASEVNRVSEAYADLQRVRANTDGVGSSGAKGELLFYRVSLDGGSPTDDTVTLSGGAAPVPAKVYSGGIVFKSNGPNGTVVANDVIGYDFGVQQNDPITIPPNAEIIQGDPLEAGTVIACTLINATTAAFSSVKPRLSVDCVQ